MHHLWFDPSNIHTVRAGNVSSLSGTYAEVMKSMAAAGRVLDIIDRVPQIPSSFNASGNSSKKDTINNPFVHGQPIEIRFDDVSFAYPTRDAPVIGPNFNLNIEAGENIALVGGSGSGKSTLGMLLARLYNLDKGSIYLDDHNISDMDPSIIREQIGVVAQEPLLFHGTIRDNIRYGRPDASDDEVSICGVSFLSYFYKQANPYLFHQVLEAAKQAHVTHFTDTLPEGLLTQVGSRGTQLRYYFEYCPSSFAHKYIRKSHMIVYLCLLHSKQWWTKTGKNIISFMPYQ